MNDKKKVCYQQRRRLSEILEVGTADGPVSRAYDVFSTLMTLINVIVTVLYTFDKMEWNYGGAVLVPRATGCFWRGDHVILYSQE